MAWGIPGNVGEIYRKQQDDELKNQLLQQEMAARMREADLRQQELSARIAEQRQMEAERAKAAERQTSLDLEKQVSPGAQTPAAAAVLRRYPATAARLSTARLDPAFGTPPIDVLAPNEKQAADATALKERNAALEQIAADPRLKTLVPLLRGGLLTSVPASAILPEEQKPDLKDLTVPGPGGQPIVKSFDAEQRAAGVPVYREPKTPPAASFDPEDAQAVADAIIRGEQPPEMTGLYRMAGPVKAALARKGYNQAEALTDWRATQRHVQTLNGTQQTRMAQAIDNAAHSLDVIDNLADRWAAGKFPPLNRAQLAAAKNGLLGKDAQTLATQLEGQISDVTGELGNVYMGGNSPTDHGLMLAAKNLSADWSRDQLKTMVAQSKRNLQIRANSMKNVGVAGASANNPYAPAGAGEIQPGGAGPKVGDIKTFPNGKKGRWDGKGWELIQ